MPAAQKVTLRNGAECSLLSISHSQASVHASGTANAIQENCATCPGSSRVKWRAIAGGNPVTIANQPNHAIAPRIAALITPNQASAFEAPRRRLGTPAPARRERDRKSVV